MVEWTINKATIKRGHQVAALPLTVANTKYERYQYRGIANQPTVVALLNRDDYLKLMRRLSSDFSKKKMAFLQSIPYFSQLSMAQA